MTATPSHSAAAPSTDARAEIPLALRPPGHESQSRRHGHWLRVGAAHQRRRPAWDGPPGLTVYKKTSQMIRPSPAGIWVVLDEREDSINDGWFAVSMNGTSATPGGAPDPSKYIIIDFPASYHHRSAGFAFADGHSEIHKWRDQRTMPILRRGQDTALRVPSPNNVDVAWIHEHSTGFK